MSSRLRAALGICRSKKVFCAHPAWVTEVCIKQCPKAISATPGKHDLASLHGQMVMGSLQGSSLQKQRGYKSWDSRLVLPCFTLLPSHHWRLVWMVPITPMGLAFYDGHWIPAQSRQQYFPFLKHSQASGLLETSLTRGKCTMPLPQHHH